jgi:glycosyltransferase involved in cell wall biosynthesis
LKVCIVTPEIVGPHKNGGIGTHCFTLCNLLKDHECTLLLTEHPSPGADQNWRALYAKNSIRVLTTENLPLNACRAAKAPFEWPLLEKSRRIAEYLERESFDLVHFQDWKANGFHSIRLRRTGLALRNTQLLVTLHSPSKWIRQGMEQPLENPIAEMHLDFTERYCCEHADLLIAPTRHMLDWAAGQGWRIQARTRVLPYPFHRKSAPAHKRSIDTTHIIFFGRLETRKGLGIFLSGLGRYLAGTSGRHPRQVSFLGKPYIHSGQKAETLIDRFARDHPQLTIHRKFHCDTHQSLDYLLQTRGVAFLPSLLDNCPFAVIECIEHDIPFMAAASGGIPEIAHAEQLFPPTANGVTKALATLAEKNWDAAHPYNAHQNNQAWRALHQGPLPQPRSPVNLTKNPPLVSVCIPYYELPDYLPQALDSIRRQSYPNMEVLVCDDGSHTTQAKAVFESEKAKAATSNWHFFQQENQGVGLARNAAAAQAEGDYLVFMDADNVARPEMIERMVVAIETSQADALTCDFAVFSRVSAPGPDTRPDFLYRPLGSVMPLGLLHNTFGDANSIVWRSAFFKIGGFRGPPLAAFADWDFFLRLHLSGGEVDVIAQPLLWYRHRPDSMLRQGNEPQEARIILAAALRDFPELARELALECTLPLYQQLAQRGLSKKSATPWHKHIYRWYRRVRKDPRYCR